MVEILGSMGLLLWISGKNIKFLMQRVSKKSLSTLLALRKIKPVWFTFMMKRNMDFLMEIPSLLEKLREWRNLMENNSRSQ